MTDAWSQKIIKDVSVELFQKQLCESQVKTGEIKGYSYFEQFSLQHVSLLAGIRVCVCDEKAVSISLSIIQSNAICQTVSLGPQRDMSRVEMRQSVCPQAYSSG